MRRNGSLRAGIVLALACGAPACGGQSKSEEGGVQGPASSAGTSGASGAVQGTAAVGGGRAASAGHMGSAAPGAAGSGSSVLAGSGGVTAAGSGGLTGEPTMGTAGASSAPNAGLEGGNGFYRMERLSRGLVAIPGMGGTFVSWRMLGFEYDRDHPENVSYELYRDGAMIAVVKDSTNYLDAQGSASSDYSVRAVVSGARGDESERVKPWADNYLRIPIEPPGANYDANDASVGDVDGDGDYEIVLKWDPSDSKDNSQKGVTSDVYLDTLTLAGQRLMRIDLGPNIRAGAHYTQFIVFDFDGDGKAEIAVKTAPGTKAGDGKFLSLGPAANDDDSKVYRNSDGYILSGPEYLTVFEAATGRELVTTNFDVPRGKVSDWGDDYGNRVDRFLAAAAYLDDTGLPSFVMARGYYTRTTLTAWNWREGALKQLWKFDSNVQPDDGKGHPYTGQGSHSMVVANIDDDKGQEIVYGAMAVDHDGKGKCSTGNGHGDALHVSDFLPDRPGLEAFMPNEDGKHPAYYMRDAGTCAIIFAGPVNGNDTGRAVADDIDPNNPGAEAWAADKTGLLDGAGGKRIGDDPSSINFLIWWDGDETRELEDKTSINKYGGGTLLSCPQCASNNGTKATPALVADVIGDWREEVLWREADNTGLRLYTTNAITTRRIYTLMHDPQYRVAIAWQNVAYNQPPHPSFHIGKDMAAPPVPDIRTR